MAASTTLTLRRLNRATLARQLLLERARDVPVAEAVERIGGLQAQEPKPPFVALWSRLDGFERADLVESLGRREVVRATLMRATLHTVSRGDYVDLRGPLQPALSASAQSVLSGRGARDLDVDAVVAAAGEVLAGGPLTFDEIRAALAERFPGAEIRALGYAVRMHVPLVMVATDDRWGFERVARFTLAAPWLGRKALPRKVDPAKLVLRHLAAFGPASAADVQAWSGVRGLKETVEALRPQLEVFRDERGRELLDLPDAPRPDEAVDAPVRYLAEFDSLVLAHDDRTRIVADEHRPGLVTKNLRVRATYLVDGFAAGTWSAARKGKRAVLTLAPFGRLTKKVLAQLEPEGDALLRFLEPDASTFEVAVEG